MYSIGIYLENEEMQVAVLKEHNKQIEVISLHRFPLSPENVQRFYSLPPFQEKIPVRIVSTLPSDEVFIRKIFLPLAKEADILKALPFQLESLIPFSSEPVVCVQTKPLERGLSAVWVFATSETKIQAHLDKLNVHNIQIDSLSCVPTALMRLVSWHFQNHNQVLTFEVRSHKVCCTLFTKENILLSQTLPYSENVFEQFLLFLQQKEVYDAKTPWVLCGDEQAAAHIQKIFPQERLVWEDPLYAEYACAIGSGLDALAPDAFRVDFCQQTLMQPLTELRKKKQLLFASAVCIVASAVILLSGSVLVDKRKSALKASIAPHLPSIVHCHSSEEIKQTLFSWETALQEKTTPFPLFPNVPKASDVLAYLSAHPALLTPEGVLKEGVEIQSVHYTLVKYPKIGAPSSPYVARVELTLLSNTPTVARTFHEALLKGDSLVNPKRGIDWKSEGSTYWISFELRNEVGS